MYTHASGEPSELVKILCIHVSKKYYQGASYTSSDLTKLGSIMLQVAIRLLGLLAGSPTPNHWLLQMDPKKHDDGANGA